MSQEATQSELLTELSLSLGQVRAEYTPDETIFATFSKPVYWGDLVGARPCVLVGGRGTGKTTTLRGLAYGGQYALKGRDLDDWDSIGAYWRVDSMVVSAFSGRGLQDTDWTPAFAHYVNLRLVALFLGFVNWRMRTLQEATKIDPEALTLASIALHIEPSGSVETLQQSVRAEMARLEARLNGNTADLFSMEFSALGRPLAYLLGGVDSTDKFSRLPFTICVDEYENLKRYQQRVVNTLIKHVGDAPYTVNLGVRESDERSRETLAPGQFLTDPADYTTIDIVEHLKDQTFTKFAAQVCERRLLGTHFAGASLARMFPSLPLEQEAKLLGGDRERRTIRQALVRENIDETSLTFFDSMPLLSACLIGYWARAQGVALRAVLEEAVANESAWNQRVGNYSYALLFTLRKGKRGVKKYYAGWSTFCQLADGNIRLMLELVYHALRTHVSEGGPVGGPVAFETQTVAASEVGETTLRELQGQSGIGGQLTRLTLSLGRVFNVFAAAPEGHTPEVNQIRIEPPIGTGDPSDLATLIREALINGCLIAFAGNKQTLVSAQTKSPDYQLHPIFSPYFVYSHRRKRRIQITPEQVLALSSEGAARAINTIILNGRRRVQELPEQLEFYSGFYDDED